MKNIVNFFSSKIKKITKTNKLNKKIHIFNKRIKDFKRFMHDSYVCLYIFVTFSTII